MSLFNKSVKGGISLKKSKLNFTSSFETSVLDVGKIVVESWSSDSPPPPPSL